MLKPVNPIAPDLGGRGITGGPQQGVPDPTSSNPHCLRLFRVGDEGRLRAGCYIGGLVIDKIIGSGHFGVGSKHLTVLVLELDRSHKMIFSVGHIDPETCITSQPGVKPEAAHCAQVVVVGEVLVLVDQELGVGVVLPLEDWPIRSKY